MSIQRFGTPTAPGALPFSKAVAADGWLYVSGTVEMLNVRGEKVIPLIEARIKEYND